MIRYPSHRRSLVFFFNINDFGSFVYYFLVRKLLLRSDFCVKSTLPKTNYLLFNYFCRSTVIRLAGKQMRTTFYNCVTWAGKSQFWNNITRVFLAGKCSNSRHHHNLNLWLLNSFGHFTLQLHVYHSLVGVGEIKQACNEKISCGYSLVLFLII